MSERGHTTTVDYLEDFPGSDLPRDLVRVALVEQDLGQVAQNLEQIGGQAQSAVDVAQKIDDIHAALASQAGDVLRVEQQTAIAVESSGGTTIDPATAALEDALKANDADEFITRVTDASGSEVNPDQSPNYPEEFNQQDLIASGDLVVGPVSVEKSQAILISANSTDSNTWSASLSWEDGSGNVILQESAGDIELSSVTQDWARVVRKGPEVEVTFTDTSAAGANNINTYVDVHR